MGITGLFAKRRIAFVPMLVSLMLFTACAKEPPQAINHRDESEETKIEEPEVVEEEEPEIIQRDYADIDLFLSSCVDKYEGAEYEEIESEEFPGCGPNIMFVVVDSVNKDPVFVRSSDETIAFTPPTIDEENLCWEPGECDAVFYVSSFTPKVYATYDNGTKGYGTETMLSVLYPKDNTAWGPIETHYESVPSVISGNHLDMDNYALYDYMEGIYYGARISGLPVYTGIECEFEETCFFFMPDQVKDNMTWQDLIGFIIEDKDGSKMEIGVDEDDYIIGRVTSSDEDLNNMIYLIRYDRRGAHPEDPVEKGRIYETVGHKAEEGE